MRNLSKKYFPIVERFHHSNLTTKIFSERNGIKKSTLEYWNKKYLDKEKSNAKGFVPLVVEEKKSACIAVIQYTDGTKLIFEGATDASLLKKFLPAFN